MDRGLRLAGFVPRPRRGCCGHRAREGGGSEGKDALKTSTCRGVGKPHLGAPKADPLLESLKEGLRDMEDEGLRLAWGDTQRQEEQAVIKGLSETGAGKSRDSDRT